MFKEKGIVKHNGCSFIIELDNGEIIDTFSNDLDVKFYEGQRVKFSYKEDPTILRFCGFGKTARIKCIKEI